MAIGKLVQGKKETAGGGGLFLGLVRYNGGELQNNLEANMPTYRVGLSRIYVIDLDAINEEEAKRGAEFFLGFHDSSNESDWDELGFRIKEIDMVENEAFEAKLLNEGEKS